MLGANFGPYHTEEYRSAMDKVYTKLKDICFRDTYSKNLFADNDHVRQAPYDPRIFVTGKVLSINEFNETAYIKFSDPFDQKKYFEYIPDEIEEAPLATLEHCYLFKESLVKWERKTYKVVEYNSNDIGFFEYSAILES